MNFDTIIAIEKFIENLNNPRKQAIARELVSNPSFHVYEMTVYNRNELLIKEIQGGNTYQLLAYINSKCNCG